MDVRGEIELVFAADRETDPQHGNEVAHSIWWFAPDSLALLGKGIGRGLAAYVEAAIFAAASESGSKAAGAVVDDKLAQVSFAILKHDGLLFHRRVQCRDLR